MAEIGDGNCDVDRTYILMGETIIDIRDSMAACDRR